MYITKQVIFVAKDDCIEELKKLLEMMVEPSRSEDGCLLYNIYQKKEHPNTFVVIETWRDEIALKGHQHSEHYKYYKKRFEPFTASKESYNLQILS